MNGSLKGQPAQKKERGKDSTPSLQTGRSQRITDWSTFFFSPVLVFPALKHILPLKRIVKN